VRETGAKFRRRGAQPLMARAVIIWSMVMISPADKASPDNVVQ
jgi:hypothetical protein